jgi:cytochrome c553
LLLVDAVPAADLSEQQVEFFETRIRPVLVERCYACHNSADTAEGGLEIDSRDGIAAAEIIVPGKPQQSRLLAILRHEIEGVEMPEDGPKLDDQKIADFEKWIADGAPDPRDQPPTPQELAEVTSWEATLQRRKQWWSFQPIAKVQPPAEQSWSAHPIDRFVIAKQQEHGLSPAPMAADVVLIRRLYLNLIGLPPSGDEVRKWNARFADDREVAVGELVDSLLESPHFGERWARHWMDWIRYAESHGSEGDPRIDNAWRYRDYLIRALNADVPYDQLVREHVAGDLLAEPRVNEELGINESMIGPAHWRMVFHGFAPTDALDEKVRFVDDQVNAFSKAFLGLTVSCARCHDHKFDAISQADYYAIFGILAACRPARAVIDLPEKQHRNLDRLAALKPKIRQAIADDWLTEIPVLAERLADPAGPSADADQPDRLLAPLHIIHQQVARGTSPADAWQQRIDAYRKDRQVSQAFAAATASQRWDLAKPADRQSWYTFGTGVARQPQNAGEFALPAAGDNAILGIYPAGVYSHGWSAKHAGRITSPDVKLDADSELWVQVIGDAGAMTRYAVQDYPRSGTVFPVTNLNPQWRWQRYDLTYWSGDSIHVEVTTGKDAPLLVKNEDRSWFGIRSAAILPTGSPAPGADREFLEPLLGDSRPAPPPQSLAQVGRYYASAIKNAVTAWRQDKASDAQARMLDRCVKEGLLANQLDKLPKAKPLIERYRQLEAEIPTPTRVPGLDETRGREQPLFIRGNHKLPGEITPRRFLEAIDPTPYAGGQSGRLQLAEDLLRDDNPLTRRVIVNRIWHHLFGRGIVGTPDNLGRLGQQPTHPELLDYLAGKFREQGWSLKQMIRDIVLSKTWQQSATCDKATYQADPDNQFLARANIRRLEAEAIRDAMLQVSGRLDENTFGPPTAGNSNRRSVYVEVIRNRLDPLLRAFDFPEPFSSTGRRDVTNVPAQSLMLMNDKAVTGYARSWAQRVLAQPGQSDTQRLQTMFTSAFSRPASTEDIQQAKTYLSESKQQQARVRQQIQQIQRRLDTQRIEIAKIKDPLRQRLLQQLSQDDADQPSGPEPIAHWEFDGDLQDAIGSLAGTAQGGAKLQTDALLVRAGGYVVTAPLTKSLKAKTLEAWVKLDNLDQRGGGVMTVQTPNGAQFDSIVFAEKDPRQWLAGSNNFARTQSFHGPPESAATQEFVHVAIAYHEDGKIVGYRNGKRYGKPYQSNGPLTFKAGDAVVSFGVRHLPATGNRLLSGAIAKARLYDRALSDEEIAASASSAPYVSDQQVIASLNDSQRSRLTDLTRQIERAERELQTLGPAPSIDELSLWTDLARAMFTFKEFIYLR